MQENKDAKPSFLDSILDKLKRKRNASDIHLIKSEMKEFIAPYKKCNCCGKTLFKKDAVREMSYGCHKEVKIFIDVIRCDCGGFNILDMTREGVCKGLCGSECDFYMVL